tara:strand:- start:279 stop:1574 length:1296 start_codon:yes stop_codon:yes gene_type:complete
MKTTIHWFRRDLRIKDNTALYHALSQNNNVQCIFIFDENIIDELPKNDHRISFIYDSLSKLNNELNKYGSTLNIYKGKPVDIFKKIITKYDIDYIYFNKDYEPYGISRDNQIKELLNNKIGLKTFKDHVVFEETEITKDDGKPYTIYTPYSKKWLKKFHETEIKEYNVDPFLKNLKKNKFLEIPSRKDLNLVKSNIIVYDYNTSNKVIINYNNTRNFPSINGTSKIGPFLRFGLISIRSLAIKSSKTDITYLKELIWRDFFAQILFNFPNVIDKSFKAKYDNIVWENNENFLEKWKNGKTGYPIVDAGMRELNNTGFMHNRVRMITASFLCKHLLVDWRFGEAYFAKKLFDYELSSNNGNWQWAAGSGCDAAPYFRVFNPYTQQEKFDGNFSYIKKWVPEYNSREYIKPLVIHKDARLRAIEHYKKYLQSI